MALSSVSSQLTVAREHALLGEYSSATVYYAGLLSQIDRYTISFNMLIRPACIIMSTTAILMCRHMLTLTDAYMLSKWRTCKSSLQAEHNLVESIHRDKSAFAHPVGVAASPASSRFQVMFQMLLLMLSAMLHWSGT